MKKTLTIAELGDILVDVICDGHSYEFEQCDRRRDGSSYKCPFCEDVCSKFIKKLEEK